jgi:hypothetical protein
MISKEGGSWSILQCGGLPVFACCTCPRGEVNLHSPPAGTAEGAFLELPIPFRAPYGELAD